MLPVHLEERLEQFEEHWGSQTAISFDDVLEGVAGELRVELLAELLMTDLELRLRGEQQLRNSDEVLQLLLTRYSELDQYPQIRAKISKHWQSLMAAPDGPEAETIAADDSDLTDPDFRPPAGLTPPCRFGGFILQKLIGVGGMGAVFAADQDDPQRQVAVKVLHSGMMTDTEAICRFEREIQIIGSIHDPGVVPVYESGMVNDRRYYVMPLYEGGTLQHRIRQGDISPRAAAVITSDLARALHHTHSVDVVHRDLKPGNVLFGPQGKPRIADFGVSRKIDDSETVTRTGQIIGTPGYIAPERIFADSDFRDNAAGDIYSLGAILYDALCGKPPHRGSSAWETLMQTVSADPVAPSRLNTAVDADLSTICLKCLERDPHRRYQSCEELHADLQCYLEGRPLLYARRPSTAECVVRWITRYPARAGLIGLSITICVTLMVTVYLTRELSHRRREASLTTLAADAASFAAHTSRASQLMSARQAGWRQRALGELQKANERAFPDRDEVSLRTQIATAAVTRDVELHAVVAEGMWCDALAFDPSGQFLALGQNQGEDGFQILICQSGQLDREPFRLWVDCAEANRQRRELGLLKAEDGARALAFSRDGNRIAVGTRHGLVHTYRWDGRSATHDATHNPVPGFEVLHLEFSCDDQNLWVLQREGHLRVITDGQVEEASAVAQKGVHHVALSPLNNARLVYRYGSADLFCHRPSDDALIWKLPDAAGWHSFSRDGRFAAVEIDSGAGVAIVNVATAAVCSELVWPDSAESGSLQYPLFGPDSSWIVTTCAEREVGVWDVASGKPVGRFVVPKRGGTPLIAVSPVAPLFAVAEHNRVGLYRVTGEELFRTVSLSPFSIEEMEFSSDEEHLITWSRVAEREQTRTSEFWNCQFLTIDEGWISSPEHLAERNDDDRFAAPWRWAPEDPELPSLALRKTLTRYSAAAEFDKNDRPFRDETHWVPASNMVSSDLHPDPSDWLTRQSDGQVLTIPKMPRQGASRGNLRLARFDENEIFRTNWSGNDSVTDDVLISASEDSIWCVAPDVESGGRILLLTQNASAESSRQITITRLLPDLSLDAKFGDNGQVVIDSAGRNPIHITDAAVQADGRIVMVGRESGSTGDSDVCVLRVECDGHPDFSFADGGWFTFGDEDLREQATSVAIQPDGSILVGGHGESNPLSSLDMLIMQLNSEGLTGGSFGTDGVSFVDYSDRIDSCEDIAVGSDGRIVLAGRSELQGEGSDFAIARLTVSGKLDKSFNQNGPDGPGRLRVRIGLNNAAKAVALLQDDRIVVAGSAYFGNSYDFAVSRVGIDGTLDASFNGTGRQHIDFLHHHDYAAGVAVTSNDGIVVTGLASYSDGSNHFGVARLRPDGSLDDTIHDPQHQLHSSNPCRFWTLSDSATFVPSASARDGSAVALELEKPGNLKLRIDDMSALNSLTADEHYPSDVYIVCRPADGIHPTAVDVTTRSEARPKTHRISLAPIDEGFHVIWAETLRWPLPDDADEIELQFDRPVTRLLLDGIAVCTHPARRTVPAAIDPEQNAHQFVLHKPTSRVWTVVDSEQLHVADFPEMAAVADWQNSSVSHSAGRGGLSSLATTDNHVIAGTHGGEVFVFDARSCRLEHKSVLLDDRVRGLCAIASDRELAVGASDGEIHIVRMPELDLRQKIDAHDLSVEALAWDPQRQWLFAASEDGVVSIWQRTDGIFVEHFRIRLNLGRIRKIHYLADSDALAVLVQGETAVRLIAVDRLCGMMQEMSLLH